MITIVSSSVCPYCIMAKNLLTDLKIEYTEVQVEIGSPEMRDIMQVSGMMTIPQIFTGEIKQENLIGGYTELTALNSQGKLADYIGK